MAEHRREPMSTREINAMGIQLTAWTILVWLLWPLDWWRSVGVVLFVIVNGGVGAVYRQERERRDRIRALRTDERND